jgi:hypothetical protein
MSPEDARRINAGERWYQNDNNYDDYQENYLRRGRDDYEESEDGEDESYENAYMSDNDDDIDNYEESNRRQSRSRNY